MSTPTTSSSNLTTIYLVGSLGRAIGHTKLEMDVFSVAEAVRAIDIVTYGKLSAYLGGPAKDKLYKVALQKKTNVVNADELKNRSGRSAIYILPTVRGRNSGGGKILAGIAILVLAYFTGGLSAGAAGWAGTGATATGAGTSLSFLGTVAVGFGVSLVIGGITQLLTPKAQGSGPSEDQAQSTSFGGNATAITQGRCVPVVYGRALMPAVPISISFNNNDMSITQAGDQGDNDFYTLNGGGTQLIP